MENQTELDRKTSQMKIQSNKKFVIAASSKTSIDDSTQLFSRNMAENEFGMGTKLKKEMI